jgi:hypothetical protein
MDLTETVKSLRDAADKLERLQFSEDSDAWGYGASMNIYGLSKNELAMFARTMGVVKKVPSDGAFCLERHIGDFSIYAFAKNREEVCTKKVIRVERVPKMAYAETGEMIDKEIVEWECDPILS